MIGPLVTRRALASGPRGAPGRTFIARYPNGSIDFFHPLHVMGTLTLMIAGGCANLMYTRSKQAAERAEYERQLTVAVKGEQRVSWESTDGR